MIRAQARRWTQPWRWLLWLAALILLAGVLRSVSLAAVGAALGRLGTGPLLLLVAANGLVLLTFTGRWWLILRARGYTIPYPTLAGYRLAAFGLSYFTPGPQFGGEPLQVHLVKKHHHVPTATAIAAVTLDKLLELLANFTFLAGGVWLISRQQLFAAGVTGAMTVVVLLLLALPVVMLALLALGYAPLSNIMRLAAPLAKRWTSAYQTALTVIRSSEVLVTTFCRQQPGTLALALLVSVVSWGTMIGEYGLMLRLLGAELDPAQMLVALTAARLAILLPLPGGLGALEASQVLAMTALGLEPALGLSLSLLIRARDVLLGGLGLWWGGLKS